MKTHKRGHTGIRRRGVGSLRGAAWLGLAATIGCSSPIALPSFDAGTDLAPTDGTSDVVSPMDSPDAPIACRADADCPAGGAVCDRDRGVCVQCRTREDCPDAMVCAQQRCVAPTPCVSDRQCSGQVCDAAFGACVDCITDTDCAPAERCRVGSCVARPRPCTSSLQCGDLGLVCDTARMECVECAGDNDCLTGDRFCGTDGRCLARVCAPGSTRCAMSGVRESCNARGSGYDETPCAVAQTCRDGACLDRVCEPGTARCAAGVFSSRELCRDDGLGYTTAACDADRSCRDGLCVAQVCRPGSANCEGTGATRRCNDDGLGYAKVMSCAPMSACDPGTGLCAGWVCMPGTRSCDGATARTCRDDGLGYTTTACGPTQSCRDGACVERACTPGAYTCAGPNARRVCDADGLGDTPAPCPSSNACLGAGVCTPWVCTPGTTTCASSAARRVCDADGQGGSEIPCGTTESCRDGVCRARLCTPGTTRCPSGAPGMIETCDADGLAWSPTSCPVGRSCSAGACAPWLCTPGAPSCVGSTGTRTCAADGLGYGATTVCTAGSSCTAETGLCGAWVCTPGSSTCDGSTRVVCNTDGLGTTRTACGTTQNCVAGVCVDRVCTPGALSCADVNTRRRCNDSGAGYDAAACPAMNACLGAGTCTPWVCTPGSNGPCSSATARQACSADGQGYVSTTCPSPANAAGVCASGTCTFTCNAGYGDCDAAPANGCEANLATSAAHCGACGRACTSGQVCTAGSCASSMAPANDVCSGAVTIPWGTSSTTLSTSNRNAGTSLTSPCGSAGADLFYRLVVPGPSREIVYADTVGSSIDTVLYFARDCTTPMPASGTPGEVVCNDDLGTVGCTATTQSTVVALLTPGTWYLVVGGYFGASGAIQLNVQHLPVGNGPVALLPAGASTQSGSTSGSGQISGTCGGSAAEATWWWRTCPTSTSGAFSATTCSRATWDTVLYLRNGDGTAGACNDDACGLQSSISATIQAGRGIHALTVDGLGPGNTGTFSVAVTRP